MFHQTRNPLTTPAVATGKPTKNFSVWRSAHVADPLRVGMGQGDQDALVVLARIRGIRRPYRGVVAGSFVTTLMRRFEATSSYRRASAACRANPEQT